MAGLNKVSLIGHLGRDPEIRYTSNDNAVANVSIATSESWKDKNTGEKVEKTEWHKLIFWNKLAEIVEKHLRKGSQIYVEGKLQTRKWQNKEGVDMYTTEIVCDTMVMLGGRDREAGEWVAVSSTSSSGTRATKGDSSREEQEPRRQGRADHDSPGANRSQSTRPAPAPKNGGPKQSAFDDLEDDIPF